MHELTSSSCMELRIEMERYSGQKYVASYSKFTVGSADSGYVLDVGGFSSVPNFNDDMAHSHGMKFSTVDMDQDTNGGNCAHQYGGGWWYKSCFYTKLTGHPYGEGNHEHAKGIHWDGINGHHESLKKVAMKIRPKTTC